MKLKKHVYFLKLFSLATALIVVTSACNKTQIEEVKFPKTVDMIVGQTCMMKIMLYKDPYYSYSQSASFMGIPISDEHQGPMYYHKETAFSDWHSNNSEIIEVRGDTLVALAQGKCEVTGIYHDDFGNHSVNCSVIVSDPVLPSSEDTIFAHYGDTVELCNFKFPGSHTIRYELEYGSGYSYSGALNSYYHNVTIGNPPIEFSPIYTYYLNMIMPNYNLISFRIFSNALDIDVTIPIVTLPSDESKEP